MSSSMPLLAGDAGPTRVLLVDDDVLVCHFLERTLQHRGFSVVYESTPEEALHRLADEDFDVVVTDMNMAGLDGLAFTRRSIAMGHDTPVILVSGSATMELAEQAALAGAWAFFPKPINTDLLAASMTRAREHCQVQRQLRERRTELGGPAAHSGV